MMLRSAPAARRRANVSPRRRDGGAASFSTIAHCAFVSHVLRARALWKSYAAGITGCSARAWVLRGASLDVERGECVVVLGARGAGATTLLHCLAGLRRLDAGSIELALSPHLVDATQLHDGLAHADRLLLVDDALLPRRHPHRMLVVREPDRAQTLVIATHELARVRHIADRVLLLHHGRLHPLDHPTSAIRVAEHEMRTPIH
jgi:ABC-type polar amino acid transport system ATPase subunit